MKEICSKLHADEEDVMRVLIELKKEFSDRGFKLENYGEKWKMIVDPKLTHVVKEMTKMEMSKAVLETLAVIAYLNPTTQSEVIKIRGNKGYEHIRELEERGFITSKKWKNTLMLRLSPKFYQYFDLKPGEEKRLLSRG